MLSRRRFAIVAALLMGWLLVTSASGCATMGQKQPPKKDGPQTVGQFLELPRVQP
jgi:hypothetical protein